MFAAMEADKGFYKEFLAFRARQQDQRRSNLSEAAPDRRTRSPTFGRSSDPVPPRDDYQRGRSMQRHAPALSRGPGCVSNGTSRSNSASPPRLKQLPGVPRLSPYTHVANLWPLHSPVQRRHLCHSRTTTGLPPTLPVIPRHTAATTRRLATHLPPPIVAIRPPLAARLLPPVATTRQPSAVPPQHLIVAVLPHLVALLPLLVNTRLAALPPVVNACLARPPPPPEPEPEPEPKPEHEPEPEPERAAPTVLAIPTSNVAPQDEVINISSSNPPEAGSSCAPITVSSSDPPDGANVDAAPNTAGLCVVCTCRMNVKVPPPPPPKKPAGRKQK
ncbi:hypothetical protein FS749_005931 [Ceratobasidium sp. UAMH 11750]|nr:hypothetical protein FS749_005931 [Ceratobasidium sp. UAMH 11750]